MYQSINAHTEYKYLSLYVHTEYKYHMSTLNTNTLDIYVHTEYKYLRSIYVQIEYIKQIP